MASLKKAGIQVAAVSYDGVDVLKTFGTKTKIDYPLLSDPGSVTFEAFGIRNKETKGSRIDGVPHPGTFLIGKDGVIQAKLFFEGYRQRHQAKDIIEAAEKSGGKKKAA